ncbi:MerR family transcriptional regulator [Flavobacteriales bacterium]|jgi:DNA-binding transcriptional MerR regulator|nr:MerR family transcriptional regulator [Flavobacteriales bacterium]
MSSNPRNTLLSVDDEFRQNFVEFLQNANDFSVFFNDARHRIDCKVSARLLNHWVDFGILKDKREHKKGWHKFSSSDLVWIDIVLRLREFGLNLDAILSVNDFLTKHHSKGDFKERPELEYFFGYCFWVKKPAYLLVFKDGEALIGREFEINNSKQSGSIKDNYISIDIAGLAQKMMKSIPINISYKENLSPLKQWVGDNIEDPELLSLNITTSKGRYVVEKTVLLENKSVALAARNLMKHGRLEETVFDGKTSKVKLTTTKHIKK